MAYLVKQIANIVNDAVADAIGANAAATELDTTDFISAGKAISAHEAYEGFFGALVNRIIKTVYFQRAYSGTARKVLRDEHEWGAFVQKVYYKMPDASNNTSFGIPQVDAVTGEKTYEQTSPYDVDTVVAVQALIYGAQGTYTFEVLIPEVQLFSAFNDESSMRSFIDGIYLTVENKVKLAEERLVNTAVNTAMAFALKNNLARNLLAEYNLAHSGATLSVSQALESADFLKFASKEIARTKANIAKMSTVFNVNGYETFTEEGNLVVEMLAEFAKATDMYLQADTFHNELVSLPNYEEVPFWQASGSNPSFVFDDTSKINIEHDDLALNAEDTETTIEQGGIICFMHDIENVAAYFGRRTTWEHWNKRDEVMIHGDKVRKGFAVDKNANGIVFYMAEAGTLTLTTGTGYTISSNITSVIKGKEIVVTVTPSDGYTITEVEFDGVEVEAGTDGKYHYIPTTEEDITVTVTATS